MTLPTTELHVRWADEELGLCKCNGHSEGKKGHWCTLSIDRPDAVRLLYRDVKAIEDTLKDFQHHANQMFHKIDVSDPPKSVPSAYVDDKVLVADAKFLHTRVPSATIGPSTGPPLSSAAAAYERGVEWHNPEQETEVEDPIPGPASYNASIDALSTSKPTRKFVFSTSSSRDPSSSVSSSIAQSMQIEASIQKDNFTVPNRRSGYSFGTAPRFPPVKTISDEPDFESVDIDSADNGEGEKEFLDEGNESGELSNAEEGKTMPHTRHQIREQTPQTGVMASKTPRSLSVSSRNGGEFVHSNPKSIEKLAYHHRTTGVVIRPPTSRPVPNRSVDTRSELERQIEELLGSTDDYLMAVDDLDTVPKLKTKSNLQRPSVSRKIVALSAASRRVPEEVSIIQKKHIPGPDFGRSIHRTKPKKRPTEEAPTVAPAKGRPNDKPIEGKDVLSMVNDLIGDMDDKDSDMKGCDQRRMSSPPRQIAESKAAEAKSVRDQKSLIDQTREEKARDALKWEEQASIARLKRRNLLKQSAVRAKSRVLEARQMSAREKRAALIAASNAAPPITALDYNVNFKPIEPALRGGATSWYAQVKSRDATKAIISSRPTAAAILAAKDVGDPSQHSFYGPALQRPWVPERLPMPASSSSTDLLKLHHKQKQLAAGLSAEARTDAGLSDEEDSPLLEIGVLLKEREESRINISAQPGPPPEVIDTEERLAAESATAAAFLRSSYAGTPYQRRALVSMGVRDDGVTSAEVMRAKAQGVTVSEYSAQLAEIAARRDEVAFVDVGGRGFSSLSAHTPQVHLSRGLGRDTVKTVRTASGAATAALIRVPFTNIPIATDPIGPGVYEGSHAAGTIAAGIAATEGVDFSRMPGRGDVVGAHGERPANAIAEERAAAAAGVVGMLPLELAEDLEREFGIGGELDLDADLVRDWKMKTGRDAVPTLYRRDRNPTKKVETPPPEPLNSEWYAAADAKEWNQARGVTEWSKQVESSAVEVDDDELREFGIDPFYAPVVATTRRGDGGRALDLDPTTVADNLRKNARDHVASFADPKKYPRFVDAKRESFSELQEKFASEDEERAARRENAEWNHGVVAMDRLTGRHEGTREAAIDDDALIREMIYGEVDQNLATKLAEERAHLIATGTDAILGARTPGNVSFAKQTSRSSGKPAGSNNANDIGNAVAAAAEEEVVRQQILEMAGMAGRYFVDKEEEIVPVSTRGALPWDKQTGRSDVPQTDLDRELADEILGIPRPDQLDLQPHTRAIDRRSRAANLSRPSGREVEVDLEPDLAQPKDGTVLDLQPHTRAIDSRSRAANLSRPSGREVEVDLEPDLAQPKDGTVLDIQPADPGEFRKGGLRPINKGKAPNMAKQQPRDSSVSSKAVDSIMEREFGVHESELKLVPKRENIEERRDKYTVKWSEAEPSSRICNFTDILEENL